jgi:predicted kinase
MRWMRDKMRRRSKRGPNTSESTGKIGQAIPTGGDTPLRPSYPDAPTSAAPEHEPAPAHFKPSAAAEAPESQAFDDLEGGNDLGPSPAESTDSPSDAAGDQPARRRIRRGRRGGRGRGSSRTPDQQSAASSPPAHAEPQAAAPQRMEIETQPDSLGVPPAEAPSVKTKSPRGFVVLAIGLPGSGKTTWFKRRSVTPLSSDLLRTLLFDDITDQRYQGLVFSTLRSLLRARLIAKMPWNYVDATNLSPHERRQWIKMAKSFGYEVQAVFFDVPFEVCMERNRRRDRVVNDEVMKTMAERLRPPDFKEGFSKITVVRVRDKSADEPANE